MRFYFFFWFFKNCELIRDFSLWHSNFIPSIHGLVIITGSRSVIYTFGSLFIYKRWVRVSIKNLNFSFFGQVFQYYLLGLKTCRLRFASFDIRAQILKSGLLSLYLLFTVIILSCSFYIHYSLLLFCDMHQVQKKKKKKT